LPFFFILYAAATECTALADRITVGKIDGESQALKTKQTWILRLNNVFLMRGKR